MKTPLALLSLFFVVACGGGGEKPAADAAEAKSTAEPVTLTVYSGRSESMVGPLFERLPEDAPFKVEVQYGKTAEMVTRLIAEGEQSPADVIFAQDSGHLGVLAARDVLEPLPQSLLSQADSRFVDPEGKWVGTSGRLRVLVYNSEKLNEETLPKSIEELADPKWKGRLGWAPTNGSLHAHIGALRHAWGDEKTQEWLKAVQANAPTRYPKNSPQVAAANEGTIDIGWVNHYYLHRLDKEGRIANEEPIRTTTGRHKIGPILLRRQGLWTSPTVRAVPKILGCFQQPGKVRRGLNSPVVEVHSSVDSTSFKSVLTGDQSHADDVFSNGYMPHPPHIAG